MCGSAQLAARNLERRSVERICPTAAPRRNCFYAEKSWVETHGHHRTLLRDRNRFFLGFRNAGGRNFFSKIRNLVAGLFVFGYRPAVVMVLITVYFPLHVSPQF